MPTGGIAGFWSYAHDDNNLDGGAILELARLLAEEFDLLSGERLELFVDRSGVFWGDLWRNRINSALAQTTFFIPIITPRYFKRDECRRELQEFAAKAKGLAAEELLLPILYIYPEGFAEDSPDELVAAVAKTQYVDWTNNRLLESGSRAYRKEVNTLAHRLLGIARKVSHDTIRKSELEDALRQIQSREINFANQLRENHERLALVTDAIHLARSDPEHTEHRRRSLAELMEALVQLQSSQGQLDIQLRDTNDIRKRLEMSLLRVSQDPAQ